MTDTNLCAFEDFDLADDILKAVAAEGYELPTPIQIKTIPDILKGRDLLGCAQTGTGKTAAFALPIIHRLCFGASKDRKIKGPRCLVLTPTRELAAQIAESFGAYGRFTPLRHTMVFGGVPQRPQVQALKKGVDVLVATPGRLLDLFRQRILKFNDIEIFVLDEADRMLDMGFIDDIRKIVDELPTKRQTLFFSATLPSSIRHLADWMLNNPLEVRVSPDTLAVDTVAQSVYFVERGDKQALLEHLLTDADNITRALVFAGTKRDAERVAMCLKHIKISAESIHSDKPQSARKRALDGFKSGKTRVLVASDIAARGIDVDDISHVINYDMPRDAEIYIHRIGRTGRAGATGIAISFCDIEERALLEQVERLIKTSVEIIEEHPYPSPLPWTRNSDVAPRRSSMRKPVRRRRLKRFR